MDKPDFSLTDEEAAKLKRNGNFGSFNVYQPDEIKTAWKLLGIDLQDRTSAAYPIGPMAVLSIAHYDRPRKPLPGMPRPPSVDSRPVQERPRPEHTSLTERILSQVRRRARNALASELNFRGGVRTSADSLAGRQTSGREHHHLWCAITASTKENGCLEFMLGTQYTCFHASRKRKSFRVSAATQGNSV